MVEDALRLPVDVDVLAFTPMRIIWASCMEVWATLPDKKKKWLILIPSWDIDRQSVYRYRSPLFLPKGSIVTCATSTTTLRRMRTILMLRPCG